LGAFGQDSNRPTEKDLTTVEVKQIEFLDLTPELESTVATVRERMENGATPFKADLPQV
jgi:hypothetical protein